MYKHDYFIIVILIVYLNYMYFLIGKSNLFPIYEDTPTNFPEYH